MSVAVIGLGTIGMRWLARFCAAGLEVSPTDQAVGGHVYPCVTPDQG